MREILFRAKERDTENWVFGFFTKNALISAHPAIIEAYDEMYLVKEETVCQYTGLEDKNGQKIFEGDIVKYQYDEDYPVYVGVVKIGCSLIKNTYKYNGWYIELKNENYYCNKELVNQDEFEVVGNIFDNPNLIERSEP